MSGPTDPRIGTELGGYRIESLIGRGGMSVVYLAEDLSLRRKVALKLLAPELAEDERFRERFVRESQLAASLDHPNIVPIFEARERDGVLYIAMRYVEGTDLKRLIESEDRLDPGRTVGILSQVASALDAAHARGLVHRDVKPGNVLVAAGSSREHVYLSDFGLTKRTSSESGITGTGQFLGTIDYAAPEQFEGRPLDARADIYSLGCVLYECLIGHPPFQRETGAAVVFAHIQAPPPRVTADRPVLPPAVDDVVARAMAKRPEDRYPTAGAIVEDARTALGVSGPGTPSIVPGRNRSTRALVVSVAAIVAIATVAGVIVARSGGGKATGSPTPTISASAVPAGASAVDRIVRIDPSTRRAVNSITVGSMPGGVAIGDGSIWVTNTDDDSVSRVDPVTNKVVATIKVGRSPIGIADGAGAVWVADELDGTVSRIDPSNNTVVAAVAVDPVPESVVADDTGVWVATGSANPYDFVGRISRIDPANNAVTVTIKLGTFCQPVLAVGGGALWAGLMTGQVSSLDPATLTARSAHNIGLPVSGIATDTGSVWTGSDGQSGTLTRIDATTHSIEQQIPIGATTDPGSAGCVPIGIAVGGGYVWATNADDGSVSVVTTVSNDAVGVVKVGGKPTAAAFGLGGVWVAVDEP